MRIAHYVWSDFFYANFEKFQKNHIDLKIRGGDRIFFKYLPYFKKQSPKRKFG